jgi:hypothetical protein
MHEIIDKKFYLGPKFGTLINKKWITISELLQGFTEQAYMCRLWHKLSYPPLAKCEARSENSRNF